MSSAALAAMREVCFLVHMDPCFASTLHPPEDENQGIEIKFVPTSRMKIKMKANTPVQSEQHCQQFKPLHSLDAVPLKCSSVPLNMNDEMRCINIYIYNQLNYIQYTHLLRIIQYLPVKFQIYPATPSHSTSKKKRLQHFSDSSQFELLCCKMD